MREQKNRVEAMEKRALALAALDQKTLTDTLVVKEYITRLSQALNGPAQSDEGYYARLLAFLLRHGRLNSIVGGCLRAQGAFEHNHLWNQSCEQRHVVADRVAGE
jgi:hypothetical protein